MYANKNGDANKCIAISEFHKNFLVFANPSSNRSEGLCLKGFPSDLWRGSQNQQSIIENTISVARAIRWGSCL